jgi:hypothetical protein
MRPSLNARLHNRLTELGIWAKCGHQDFRFANQSKELLIID